MVQDLLDNGPVVLTIDRDYWLLMKYLKKTYERGSVLIMPYVSSTFVDVQEMPILTSAARNPNTWYAARISPLPPIHPAQGPPLSGAHDVTCDVHRFATGWPSLPTRTTRSPEMQFLGGNSPPFSV